MACILMGVLSLLPAQHNSAEVKGPPLRLSVLIGWLDADGQHLRGVVIEGQPIGVQLALINVGAERAHDQFARESEEALRRAAIEGRVISMQPFSLDESAHVELPTGPGGWTSFVSFRVIRILEAQGPGGSDTELEWIDESACRSVLTHAMSGKHQQGAIRSVPAVAVARFGPEVSSQMPHGKYVVEAVFDCRAEEPWDTCEERLVARSDPFVVRSAQTVREQSAVYYWTATHHLKEAEYDKARAAGRALLEFNPPYMGHVGHIFVAEGYAREGRLEDAVAEYDRYVARLPGGDSSVAGKKARRKQQAFLRRLAAAEASRDGDG